MRILLRHLLPNALGPVVVYATLTVPAVILLESFLSFLGLGVALSWGELVAEGVSVVNPVRSYLVAAGVSERLPGRDAPRAELPGRRPARRPRPAVAGVSAPAPRPAGAAPLLEVQGLAVRFPGEAGELRAVDGLSFQLARGEVLGLVGESGCGKSAAALALLDLVTPPGRRAAGRILWDGVDVAAQGPRGFRALRGRRIAMVFQDPMTSLNPYLRVGEQLVESARLRGAGRREALARARALLERVGIGEAARQLRAWPHELSGGQRQRVMLAMALLGEPELLVADEPTTALDVTTQAQILALLRELQRERGLAVLFITHDLAVAAGLCDRVAVMYAGRLVEEAPAAALFARPLHPYTEALLACSPRLDGPRGERLAEHRRAAPAAPGAGERLHLRAALPARAAGLPRRASRPSWRGADAAGAASRPRRSSPRRRARCMSEAIRHESATPLLSVRGLCVDYGARRVLHGVGFDLARGETLALVGESGSGKSTLARALAGLLGVAEGSARFDGVELLALRPRAVAAAAAPSPARVPGSLLEPRSAASGRHDRGRAPRDPRSACPARAAGRGWPSCSPRWGSPRSSRRAGPISSRGASASASAWRGPSPSSPSCCCSTSRSPPSTCRCRRRS